MEKICTRLIINIGECWIYCNGIWIRLLHRPQWTVEGFESLDTSNWYLSVANHQSWADIFVLQDITNRKIPMLKFFMKHVPYMGSGYWISLVGFRYAFFKAIFQRTFREKS